MSEQNKINADIISLKLTNKLTHWEEEHDSEFFAYVEIFEHGTISIRNYEDESMYQDTNWLDIETVKEILKAYEILKTK